MFFFCKQDMVGNTLKYLNNNKKQVRAQKGLMSKLLIASVTPLPEIPIFRCCETSKQTKATQDN